MNEIKRNYWVFKTVKDGDRSYRSHSGYDDIISSKYVYDSNVANSKQIKSNDMVVLVDKEHILGFAKINRIESYASTKEISRCPVSDCGSTNYESRKTKTPKYRCNRGHEFHEPKKDVVDILKYESYYGDSFTPSRKETLISVLKKYYNRGYNRNMSIQSIDESFFKDIEEGLFDSLKISNYYIPPDHSYNNMVNEPNSSYSPTNNDEREKVNGQITARRGQPKFRKELIARYNSKCCVTGCTILHLLEAAHISPYRGEKDNHPSNGLLLRADIHTLFDLDMIGIHPEKLTIYLNDEIKKDKYEELEGLNLHGKPSKEALKIKWNLFLKNS